MFRPFTEHSVHSDPCRKKIYGPIEVLRILICVFGALFPDLASSRSQKGGVMGSVFSSSSFRRKRTILGLV